MACSQEPLPTNTAVDRPLSHEVFRIFCKRVAKATYKDERTGARFDAPCDGQAMPEVQVDGNIDTRRLASIVQHRDETIVALDDFFGRSNIEGGAKFADGELDAFLNSLVPFYDPPDLILPKASRGIADVMAKLIDPNDARSTDVLATLERIGPRKGYRPPAHALGALRPILSYERLDEVAKTLLAVLGTDGKGKAGLGQPGLLALLRGLALELALPAEPEEPGDSSLDILLRDLLYKELPGLEGEPNSWIVARDENDNAKSANGGSTASPFATPGEAATTMRDAEGRALTAGGQPAYEYINIGHSVFAGMVREAKGIASPQLGAPKSALENLGAGLVSVYGADAVRTQKFSSNDYTFTGADLSASPLFDLAHAIAVIMRYPETEELLDLLGELIDKQEDASATVDRLGLQLREISKKPEYANAKAVGYDGNPDSPTDFWDDVIGVGMRMLSREGMVTSLIKGFGDPKGAAQGKLYGNWMRFRDDITYIGAPIMPSGTAPDDSAGAYTAEQKTQMNTPLTQQYANPVDRNLPDQGMNRSVWQRTLSLINSLNGKKLCNKNGASLTVGTNLIGNLKFPLEKDGYAECELVEIGDAVEIYAQSVNGDARVNLKDLNPVGLGSVSSPLGIVKGVDAGSPFGKIQEVYSDINGFTDAPTAPSLARFLYAPNNKFMQNLFDPITTNDGIDVRSFEPNALFHMEIGQAAAGGASLLNAGAVLMKSLDSTESRDLTTGKLADGYMFGHMLSALHRHWPSHSAQPCTAPFPPGMEGCSQSITKDAPFYAAQSNLVSYEPMLAEMLVDADATGVLQRAAAVVENTQVNGKSGLTIIGNFVARMLTPDPAISYRDGRKYALTNSCTDTGAGECVGGIGRVIPQVNPMYLVLDALKGIDQQFKNPKNTPNLEAWHQARSSLVDQFLATDVSTGTTRLSNQNGRQLGVALCRFGAEQLRRHREQGDLEQWSDGLTDRMLSVLDHPITSAAVNVLDALYKSPDAARELAKVTAKITDPVASPRDFVGMLTAIADTAEFVSKDPDLTPVVQFAALVAAPNAFTALDSRDTPKAEDSAAYAAIELSRAVMSVEKTAETSAISRLLKNFVSPTPRGESSVENIFDIVGEVNRRDPLTPTSALLTADDYRAVFTQLQAFLTDGDRGLERLYKVIQGRKAD